MEKLDFHVIQCARFVDERGVLSFCNEFNLATIKRFYILENDQENPIRAWQGHKKEQKWFYVISGSFKIVLIKPDNWTSPSTNQQCHEFILSKEKNQILHVPKGYLNGFKSCEHSSSLMIFSDSTVEESSKDDFRFDKDLWFKW